MLPWWERRRARKAPPTSPRIVARDRLPSVVTPLEHKYTPCYCEENVFHLAAEPAFARRRPTIVFISNEAKECPVFHQRAARDAGSAMVWDYHVVLLCPAPWEICDLDTTLPFPCPAVDYLARSFHQNGDATWQPRFRLVAASLFARTFASDRSHMRTATGEYIHEPPPWPCIGVEGAASNLARFVDMKEPFLGEVMGLTELFERVSET